MTNLTITGFVKSLQTQEPIEGLTLELWDSGHQFPEAMATAFSGADGTFIVELFEAEYHEHFDGAWPDIYFVVKDHHEVIHTSTPYTVDPQQSALEVECLINRPEVITEVISTWDPIVSLPSVSTDLSVFGDREVSITSIDTLETDAAITTEEASTLRLAIETHHLGGENEVFTSWLMAEEWSHLGNNTMRSLSDLVVLEESDWVTAFESNPMAIPAGNSIEGFANDIHHTIATLYPTKHFAHHGLGTIDASNTDTVAPFLRGFQIESVLEDATLTDVEKQEEVIRLHGITQHFFETHQDFELTTADLSANGLDSLDLTTIAADDRSGLIASLKHYQRLSLISPSAIETNSLVAAGFNSAMEVAAISLEELIEITGMQSQRAALVYKEALDRSVSNNLGMMSVMDILRDLSGGISFDNTAPEVGEMLKEIPGIR